MSRFVRFRNLLISVLLCAVAFPSVVAARDEVATLSIKYMGTFDRVDVLVNNVARGFVLRGQTLSLQLPANATYQVVLTRDGAAEAKSAYLAPGLQRQLVFHGPNVPSESESVNGRIVVQLEGQFDWADVIINEEPNGRVSRGVAGEFKVKASETYTVRVSRNGRSASVSVYVGSGSNLNRKLVRLAL